MRHQQMMSWREGALCALLPMLIEVALGVRHAALLLAGGLINPDSYMRMVRLRDILAAHQPLHVVARDASGQGTILHWSHLLDSFLLLLAEPFRWFVPPDTALHAAALLFGPLTVGALGVALVWAVAPFADRSWRWLAPIAATLSPAVGSYGLIGVVHHHILVAIVAVMTWGWMLRLITSPPTPGGAVALGAWAAVGVWLTPESLPLSILAFGGLWIAWLSASDGRALAGAIRTIGLAFFAVIVAAYLVDPPVSSYGGQDIDRISLVFVGVAAVVAILGMAICVADRFASSWTGRVISSVLSGLCLSMVWLLCFRGILTGADRLVSDADWHAMFDHINEMQPVQSISGFVRYLFTGVLAIGVLIYLLVRHRSPILAYATICVAAVEILGQAHVRFAAYPTLAASALLPVALSEIEQRACSARLQSIMRLAAITLCLIVPYIGALSVPAAEARIAAADATHCAIDGLTTMLAPYGDAVILANVNDSPELLYRTRLRTVGSLYHRNPAAFLRLRAAWRSRPDAGSAIPPKEVLATNASLVLFCKSAGRSPLVGDLPPDTLLDRLGRGVIPVWLRPITQDPVSGNILFRITR